MYADHIRWTDPRLFPKGLLQEAPAPRSLLEARWDIAERAVKLAPRESANG